MRTKDGRLEGAVTISPAPASEETARMKKGKIYWVREDVKCKTSSRHWTQWTLRCRCDIAETGEERWLMYW